MSQKQPERAPSAFRPVPRTGVIYVTAEATRAGFRAEDPDWCNLGQGQPETGPLPGAPPRITDLTIATNDQEYAPVAGLWEVREAVASMYNDLFRRGMPSKYSAENVAVCGGGRVSIMRACAAIGQIHLGHFLPDYTAYEELLDIFRRFTPIPILLDPEHGYDFSLDALRREISGRGLGALLLSNPCNPTGKAITGPELASWVATARDLDCTLLLDEFYSHYLWKDGPSLCSAAEFVEDVERDPVVIFDGLTKNWRYPGWRVSWTVGPSKVIESLSSAGSFLDGGGSRPMQSAAIPLLTADYARAEAEAIRTAAKSAIACSTACARSACASSVSPRARFTAGGISPICRPRSTPAIRCFAPRSNTRSSPCLGISSTSIPGSGVAAALRASCTTRAFRSARARPRSTTPSRASGGS